MFSIQGEHQLQWDEERDAAPMVGQRIEHAGRSYVVLAGARTRSKGAEIVLVSLARRINGELPTEPT